MGKKAVKILMLVENNFPEDPRVRNEAHALKQAGYEITVIALRNEHQRSVEEVGGIRVYRIPTVTFFDKRSQGASRLQQLANRLTSVAGYLFEYFYFISASLVTSLYILLKEGFDVIHTHTPPNVLFVTGALYRLLGKKFVLDHHDLSPELYLSRFGADRDLVYRILVIEEKLALRFAHLVIATNESYKRIEMKRANLTPEKIFVVRNGPDLNRIKLVAPDEKLKSMRKTILGYVGQINPQDGLDYLLRSLKYLVEELRRTDFYCVVIGSGDALEALEAQVRELEIEDYVWLTGYIPDEDMLRYLSTADICVDPDPSSPLNDVSTWIKIMEYMALKKPIVSYDLPETRYSAQQAALYVPPNDEKKFAEAIVQLMDDPTERARMGEAGYRRVIDTLAWQHVSKNLLSAYETLLHKPSQKHTTPFPPSDEKMPRPQITHESTV